MGRIGVNSAITEVVVERKTVRGATQGVEVLGKNVHHFADISIIWDDSEKVVFLVEKLIEINENVFVTDYIYEVQVTSDEAVFMEENRTADFGFT